jgi:broad specificity phosphatase PhoE
MINNEILTIRHLPDTNDLSSGLDMPILEDQGDSMVELSTRIITKLHESGASSVQIITSNQKRTSETATILQKTLQGSNVEQVDVRVENQIRSLDQGTMNLPPDYKPGDDFPPLKLAWGPFWEHVKNGDIFYRFGQAEVQDGLEYHELKNAFKEYGESYAEILIRHLNFIHSLLQDKNENVLNVFIGHSINQVVSPSPMQSIEVLADDIRAGLLHKETAPPSLSHAFHPRGRATRYSRLAIN